MHHGTLQHPLQSDGLLGDRFALIRQALELMGHEILEHGAQGVKIPTAIADNILPVAVEQNGIEDMLVITSYSIHYTKLYDGKGG